MADVLYHTNVQHQVSFVVFHDLSLSPRYFEGGIISVNKGNI